MPNNGLRFSYVGLHVGDMDKALPWFADRLQLEVISQGIESDPAVAVLTGKPAQTLSSAKLAFPETDATVRLYQNKGAPDVDNDHANPGTCHVAFYTDDMETTWSNLAQGGTRLISTGLIQIHGGVFDGGKAIYCVGPNGFRIEFLEGRAFLDGTVRDPRLAPKGRRANEGSHIGIQVRDRDRSLAFYRDLLGFEQVTAWLEKSPSVKAVIGYPEAELFMAILRMPGTTAYFEVIEYRNTHGRPIDTNNANNGTLHLAFLVPDLDALAVRLKEFGASIFGGGITDSASGTRELICEDPDGIRVRFIEDRG